jgi:hypothetical protein
VSNQSHSTVDTSSEIALSGLSNDPMKTASRPVIASSFTCGQDGHAHMMLVGYMPYILEGTQSRSTAPATSENALEGHSNGPITTASQSVVASKFVIHMWPGWVC